MTYLDSINKLRRGGLFGLKEKEQSIRREARNLSKGNETVKKGLSFRSINVWGKWKR